MKTLKNFIIESTYIKESESSKTITFNFKDLENAKETIESLKDRDGVEISDDNVTVTVTADNVSKLEAVQDILQQL